MVGCYGYIGTKERQEVYCVEQYFNWKLNVRAENAQMLRNLGDHTEIQQAS